MTKKPRNLALVIDALVAAEPELAERLASTRDSVFFTAPEYMSSLWSEGGTILEAFAPFGHPKAPLLGRIYNGAETVCWKGQICVPHDGGREELEQLGFAVTRFIAAETIGVFYEIAGPDEAVYALHAAHGNGIGPAAPWRWSLRAMLENGAVSA